MPDRVILANSFRAEKEEIEVAVGLCLSASDRPEDCGYERLNLPTGDRFTQALEELETQRGERLDVRGGKVIAVKTVEESVASPAFQDDPFANKPL